MTGWIGSDIQIGAPFCKKFFCCNEFFAGSVSGGNLIVGNGESNDCQTVRLIGAIKREICLGLL